MIDDEDRGEGKLTKALIIRVYENDEELGIRAAVVPLFPLLTIFAQVVGCLAHCLTPFFLFPVPEIPAPPPPFSSSSFLAWGVVGTRAVGFLLFLAFFMIPQLYRQTVFFRSLARAGSFLHNILLSAAGLGIPLVFGSISCAAYVEPTG